MAVLSCGYTKRCVLSERYDGYTGRLVDHSYNNYSASMVIVNKERQQCLSLLIHVAPVITQPINRDESESASGPSVA